MTHTLEHIPPIDISRLVYGNTQSSKKLAAVTKQGENLILRKNPLKLAQHVNNCTPVSAFLIFMYGRNTYFFSAPFPVSFVSLIAQIVLKMCLEQGREGWFSALMRATTSGISSADLLELDHECGQHGLPKFTPNSPALLKFHKGFPIRDDQNCSYLWDEELC